MSCDANYKTDKMFFEEYYSTPEAERSLRKLGYKYSCSYENIRRKIYRYRVTMENYELFSVLPYRICLLLINNQIKSVENVQQATNQKILKIKGLGVRFLTIIRKKIPYKGKSKNLIIKTKKEEVEFKKKCRKTKKWKKSSLWNRRRFTTEHKKRISLTMKIYWQNKRNCL